jgi:hypothetical protein
VRGGHRWVRLVRRCVLWDVIRGVVESPLPRIVELDVDQFVQERAADVYGHDLAALPSSFSRLGDLVLPEADTVRALLCLQSEPF